MSNSMNNKIFIGTILMMGIFLLVVSIFLTKKYNDSAGCSLDKSHSTKINNSIAAIRAISIIMITSAVAFLICQWRCDCTGTGSGTVMLNSTMMFAIMCMILGVGLIALASLIVANSKGDCADTKSWGIGVLIIGVLMCCSSIAYFSLRMYKHVKPILKGGGHGGSDNYGFRYGMMDRHGLKGGNEHFTF